MCTRLFIRGTIRERWFCLTDGAKPWELDLEVMRSVPKDNDCSVDIGGGVGFLIFRRNVVSFRKVVTIRAVSKYYAKQAIQLIETFKWCIRCGNPFECPKALRPNFTAIARPLPSHRPILEHPTEGPQIKTAPTTYKKRDETNTINPVI